MDHRFTMLADAAARNHGVFTTALAQGLGISDRLRNDWLEQRKIERLGKHTFRFVGVPQTWHMKVAAALGDLGSGAAVSGRSAAVMHHLDGFAQGRAEIWVPRSRRNRASDSLVRSSASPLLRGDVVMIDGMGCVSAERLILDSLLFGFSPEEISNAIDSALRMRLVGEARLRRRIVEDLAINARHRTTLIAALVDTGGESALERRFLAILRQAGLPRPDLQKVYCQGGRTMARIDAEFPGNLIVEVAGHATHATRTQRQRDEQRRTELTLLGKRVFTFTYEDVYGRPGWMLDRLRQAGAAAAA